MQSSFANMRRVDNKRVIFSETDHSSSDVLRFVSERHISLLKLERIEPTLEDLFMEVADK